MSREEKDLPKGYRKSAGTAVACQRSDTSSPVSLKEAGRCWLASIVLHVVRMLSGISVQKCCNPANGPRRMRVNTRFSSSPRRAARSAHEDRSNARLAFPVARWAMGRPWERISRPVIGYTGEVRTVARSRPRSEDVCGWWRARESPYLALDEPYWRTRRLVSPARLRRTPSRTAASPEGSMSRLRR